MKTNVQTLSAASHSINNLANWLSNRNSFLSQLLSCRVSNLSLLGVIAFAIFAVAALLLASDMLQLYGWAAFCGLAALNSAMSLVLEVKKGGE